MAEVNAAITSRPDLSMAEGRAHNNTFDFNTNNYILGRKPDYYVYLFNVSEETYKVARPPIAKEILIPGKKPGQEYGFVGRIPQPLILREENVDASVGRIGTEDARRFAMDIINSENLGFDQDAVMDPRYSFSKGHDLGKKGVFWSLNEIPTAEEIKKAVNRMEKEYTRLLDEALAVERSNPQMLREMLTPAHHAAAEYFGQEQSWHGKKSKPMDCPVCGDRVKYGIAYHIDAANELCIIDWARTVKAGKRSRAQAFEATGDPQFAPQVSAQATKPVVKSNIPTEEV
jgi:hypothetical protein